MKRKMSNFSSEFVRFPRPHIDDVEELIELLSEDSLSVEVADSDYEYENLDELVAKRGRRVKNLEIKAAATNSYGETISVTLGDGEARAFRFGNAATFDRAWLRLLQLLKSRQRWYQVLLIPWVWVATFPLSLGFGSLALRVWGTANVDKITLTVIAFVLVMALLSWLAKSRAAVIVLEPRHEAGFFKKRREDIFILVIGALFGSVLTGAVQILINALSK